MQYGYYLHVDDCKLFYVPRCFVVIENDDCDVNIKMSPSEVKLFDNYLKENKICLYENGIICNSDSIEFFSEVSLSDNFVKGIIDKCFTGKTLEAKVNVSDKFEEIKQDLFYGYE